jgi:hypothetical protein
MPVTTNAHQQVVKLLVPRNNMRDALATEVMLSTLTEDTPFALEIVGETRQRAFQVRGAPDVLNRVLGQLRFAYPQCEFEAVTPKEDCAEKLGVARRGFELRLREAPYLPLRTHISREGRVTNDDQAQGADPLMGVLAAMDGLQPGESALMQIALRPMPPNWSQYWRGAQTDVGMRTKAAPTALGGTILFSMGLLFVFMGLLFVLLSVLARSLALLPWILGLCAVGGAMVYLRFRLPSPPDPLFVRQKINNSAFRARIRVWITANSFDRAEARVRQMQAAFNAYNLSGGNGFVMRPLAGADAQTDAPSQMTLAPDRGLASLPLVGFLRKPDADLPILNTSELATLWHLPHSAAAMQGIATTTSKSIMPLDADVSDGIRIGESHHQNQSTAIHLSQAMLRGHVGMVARTQSGKSNLMALMISQVMQAEPEAAIIVLDPHRRLAQTLAGLIPEARRDSAIFLSLADREYPFGLNLLDRMPRLRKTKDGPSYAMQGFTDKLVSDIIATLNEIWPENWGPRMENYLRWSLLTLGYANEVMIADHQYLEWRAQVTQTCVYLKDRLQRRLMTSDDWKLAMEDYLAFNQLTRPPLGTIARQYDELRTLYGRYDQAQRGELEGKASSVNARPLILAELCETLITWAKTGYKRSGISQRLYAPASTALKRPLQFTLLDVNALMLREAFRTRILGALAAPGLRHVRRWWSESYWIYHATSSRLLLEMIQPVLSKIDRFSASTESRRIFGQPETTIDIPGIVTGGGTLIVDLAAGVVGQDTAALIGSTMMNWIASTLFSQQEQDGLSSTGVSKPTRPVYVIIDEFHAVPGIDYPLLLAELGKYGARVVLGTQSLKFLDQVNERARATWLDNTATLFVFRCGAEDAEVLAKELSITDDNPLSITPSDIVGLPDYTCYIRTRNARGQQRVFQCLTDKAPTPSAVTSEKVREQSRQKYCHRAEDVDAWIAQAQTDQGEIDMSGMSSNGHRPSTATNATSMAVAPAIEQNTQEDREGPELAPVMTNGATIEDEMKDVLD